MQENRAVEDIMRYPPLSKQYFLDKDADKTELKEQFIRLINSLEAYELHYTKKEHVLFHTSKKPSPTTVPAADVVLSRRFPPQFKTTQRTFYRQTT
jgi:DUF438 domain-containing protein